jgi:phosphatidylglycerophosphate synthase
MISGICAGIVLASTRQPSWETGGFVLGALFIQLRLMANMFDGMVAIESKRASAVGELFNEIPDRVSDAATLVGAGYAFGGVPELGYAAAILALFIAYIRAQGRVAGASQEYCGPMAKQQRMFVITVASLIAAFVPHEWQPTPPSMPAFGWMSWGLAIILVGSIVTVFRRLQRITAALRSRTT